MKTPNHQGKNDFSLVKYQYHFTDNKLIGQRRICTFELLLASGETLTRLDVRFDQLLTECEERMPEVFDYIKGLEEDIDASVLDYTELVEALEQEGFDFDLLVHNYVNQLSADSLYPADAPPPEMLEAAEQVAAYFREMGFDKMQEAMTAFQHLIMYLELHQCFYKTAKMLLQSSFPHLLELSKARRKEFYELVDGHIGMVTLKFHVLLGLEQGWIEMSAAFEKTLASLEPEARRKRILERRTPEPYHDAFTVALAGLEDWWNVTGDNTVMLYVHVMTGEGDAYADVLFKDIKEEADLRDPALYERILALEGNLPGVWPKEQEVVDALLAEGRDLMPLIHSFLKEAGDLKNCLLWKSLADKSGYEPPGEYYEYLKRKDGMEPDNISLWRQMCHKAETRLLDGLMEMIEDKYPDLLSAHDYRITEEVIYDLKAICSNLLEDTIDSFSDLFGDVPVWPEKREVRGEGAGL